MKYFKGQRVTNGTDKRQPGTIISEPNQEHCNPLIEVLWDTTHRIELVRAEYLYTSYVKQVA